jgi:hypothetical protein
MDGFNRMYLCFLKNKNMETTKTSETLLDNAKVAEKWFNDASTSMMDLFNKQLNLTTGYYSNLLNSTFSNTKDWGVNQGFIDNFLGGNSTKWLTPFNTFSSNNNSSYFFSTFDKMYKQIVESNRHFFTEFNNQLKTNEIDWNSINKEYKETMDRRIESSRKILSSITDSYSKQLHFTLDMEKNMFEELNNQFNSVMRQNQKMLSDFLNTYQNAFNGEEIKSKEAEIPENKKRTSVPVVA